METIMMVSPVRVAADGFQAPARAVHDRSPVLETSWYSRRYLRHTMLQRNSVWRRNSEPGRGVHVVERGHRGDHVERGRLERMREEVAHHVRDAAPVRAGLLDAGLVQVDPGDVRHGPAQLAGERALAAAETPDPRPARAGHRGAVAHAARMTLRSRS
jgi:hypothetical protein